MSKEQLSGAAKLLVAVLDDKKIPYALMGGSACSILGSTRATKDIDLCITPVKINGKEFDAAAISDDLIKNHKDFIDPVDPDGIGHYIPQIKYKGAHFTVDIFDAKTWPNRPQYDIGKSSREKEDGIYIFSPEWLLREKVATLADRNTNPGKKASDKFDIGFLIKPEFIPASDYGKKELNLATSEYHRTKFNEVINSTDETLLSSEVKAILKKIFIGY